MKEPKSIPQSKLFFFLAISSLLLLPASVLVIGLYAPTEARLGIVQKIFYFHVSSAFMMYAGFGVAFLGSILFLFTGKKKWDAHAVTGAEVGLLFATLVLVSGPLWAYKSWGGFWTWDPQLTATLIVYLLFWSYMAVRAFAVRGERRRTISAIIAVLATPNIAFIHWAVTITHPKVIRSSGGGLATSMVYTLIFALVAITCLFATLYLFRLHLEKEQNRLARLKERIFSLQDKRYQVKVQTSLALAPVLLLAQSAGVQTEFVAASQPTETIPGGTLLVIAYAAMWAIVLLYLISLWRRQGRVYKEMTSLGQSVKQLEGGEE